MTTPAPAPSHPGVTVPPPSEDAIAALMASGPYRIQQPASRLGRRLAILLQGGKKANPNVTQAARVALEAEAYFIAIQRFSPALQKPRGEPQERPNVLDSTDLATLMGAASSDARYLKHLTRGGLGMSSNMVDPLRVLRELRLKLAVIQARWPEMQGDDAFRLFPVKEGNPRRRTAAEKALDDLIASGEVSFGRPQEAAPSAV